MKLDEWGGREVHLLHGPPGREWGGGIYALILNVKAKEIDVGSLGRVEFLGEWALYLGSARGGFRGRVGRHFRREKVRRWHIDYLTGLSSPWGVVIIPGAEKSLEETLAFELSRRLPCVEGFGSSDDLSPSHLFLGTSPQELIGELLKCLRSIS